MTTRPTTLLDALRRANALRPLDHAFAQTLRRLDPATPDAILAAAALASLAVSAGHAAFNPAEPWLLAGGDIDWPNPEDWRQAIAASRWVSQPQAAAEEATTEAPLVLEHGLLYLRRYREYERRLATHLHRIATSTPDPTNVEALAPLFAQLFPAPTPTPAAAVVPAANEADEGDEGDTTPQLALLPPAGEGARRADEGALHPDQTIPNPPADTRQPRAAALALRHNLLLLTGGPGTGKTTTITRLLVLLVAQAAQAGKPAPKIALAAPTGRAAERMAASVRRALQSLAATGIDPALLEPLPTAGTTLHRLLGTVPDSPRVRHHADNPLPHDIVVVDEASMIDLPLMAKLAEAIAPGTRLVLIGDPDQLPSVEAGDVLTGILRAAGPGETLAPEDAKALRPLLAPAEFDRHPREGGDPCPPTSRQATSPDSSIRGDDKQTQFPAPRVHLTHPYRQSETLHLAPLAAAIRDSADPTHRTRAIDLLRAGTLANVHFHENLHDPLQTHRDHLLAHWRALAAAATPAEALALADRLRILATVREGPQGARTLNARIEALLTDTRRRADPYFHGRLLLVTENNPQARLFNGDIGVCLRDERGALMAWFPGDTPDRPRAFHPAALPAHDSAFAMTVHKAQGSEFDEVWLLLPERENRVLTRELVYTGITRARRELHLAGSANVIEAALTRHASRWSGLGWRLSA